jgi:hypothetical protein
MEPKEPDITEVAHSLKDASTLTEPSKCVCSPVDPQKLQDGEESCHTESSSIPEKGQVSPREEEVISCGKMVEAASIPVQSAEDISQSEQEAGLKSEDEGFDSLGSSGVDSSSEDNLTDEKEPEAEQRKEKDSPDSSAEEEDGGLGSEAASTATIAKSRSEKDIKNKILSILNEAKAKENDSRGGRAVRNYGRTFEQAVQLTPPVLANDKRPEKARRMDSLWSQSVARRQGTNFNGVEVAAKPVAARGVPWSQRANNNAAVKKDSVIYNTEVEEFDKCRKNLETSKQAGKGAAAVAITVKSILKTTSDSKERIRETKAPVKEQQQSSEKVTEEETPAKVTEEVISIDIALKDKDIISDSAVVSSELCKEVVPSNQTTEEDNLLVHETLDCSEKSIAAVAESTAASTDQLPKLPASDSTDKASTQSSPDVPTSPLQKASDVQALPGPEKSSQALPVHDATSVPVRNASAAPVRETSVLLVTPSTPITRRRADLGPSLLMPAPRAGTELKETNSMSHSRKKKLQSSSVVLVLGY